ncbi:SCO family protein [Flammeovirga kamogawensis]|uniref:SCO family protein n=1 Tax=Flammeovirga kamogawensis TaxID=373891 RepID=A0ABX8GXJ4_9BACT|nr:SCO family protein [Flammeovirga kamogawensis]MBB6463927.1 protein SCO1/2 [Flammeovirga kamogawensis]QWG08310.1 SCO family protein [Flammeovirga kamogawensis]TRX66606.1 SCO family protein [Flammeovirga kamogawensis]
MLQTQFFKLLFVGILFTSFSCNKEKTIPFYTTPDFTPHFLSDAKEINDKIAHRISDFSFLNQNNRTITQQAIEGKIHVANFIFTSCGSICPVMTDNMKIVESHYKNDEDVALLSYSVTPWIDNVEVLKEYADNKNIKSANWHLLTGNKAEIYNLARTSYFAEEDLGFTKDSTDFLHTEHFILVDGDKRIRGIYNGTLMLEMKQLIQDIEALKEEKSIFAML